MPGQHPSELTQKADFERLQGEVAGLSPNVDRDGILIRELQGRNNAQAAQIAALEKGRVLDVQRLLGSSDTYNPIATGQGFLTGPGIAMRLDYTPPVDCWWEVTATIGILQKTDAAYHLGYVGITLQPADVDGMNTLYLGETQHSTVQTYMNRQVTRKYKLAGGVAYYVRAVFSCNGGNWQFFMGQAYNGIEGRAWAR